MIVLLFDDYLAWFNFSYFIFITEVAWRLWSFSESDRGFCEKLWLLSEREVSYCQYSLQKKLIYLCAVYIVSTPYYKTLYKIRQINFTETFRLFSPHVPKNQF